MWVATAKLTDDSTRSRFLILISFFNISMLCAVDVLFAVKQQLKTCTQKASLER